MSPQSDDPRLWDFQAAPVQPRPAEPLFEFVTSDGQPISCALRFHGESYGWEAMFLKRGELYFSRRFPLRADAIAWAEAERPGIESGYTE